MKDQLKCYRWAGDSTGIEMFALHMTDIILTALVYLLPNIVLLKYR